MQVDASSYYMNAYAASASYRTSNVSVSGSYLEITGGMSALGAKDGVEVSEMAKKLSERIKELDIFKIIFPNNDARQKTKSLDEVEGDFQADFYDFSSTFSKMSAMMGLDSSQSFTMGLNGVGGMTVDGTDAGMAEKLQGMFNNPANSTMVSRFAVMAARAALADAGDTVDGFKDSYAKDPVGAIQNNIDALKERLLGFRTQASGGTMNYGFIRSFNMELDYSEYSVNYAAAQEEAEAVA